MTTSFTKKRKAQTGLPRELAGFKPVALGCAVLMLATGAQAQQTPPPNQLDTVVVTGIRKGIEDAINVKKNNDSIVEAISAEDIGKLPDTSVAESIARLPGVAAQRTAGRAQSISIRGLSPDFSTGLLNGREQVSTGDSRGVEFDQYPSELLSGVVIYKTPDAALIGQGLAGTVDLQTVRPLNFSKRTLAVNYRKERLGVGTNSTGDGYRGSFSYIDQFADRKIGIALGFARLNETGGTTTRFESWGGGTAAFGGGTVNVPFNGFNAWSDQTNQRRDGAMASLQFKPNANFESVVDVFYSKFNQNKSTVGFQAPLNDSYVAADNMYEKPGVLVTGPGPTSGAFNNVRAVIRNDAVQTNDKTNSVGWNNKLKIDEKWSAMMDLNHSVAKSNGYNLETYAGTPQATGGTAAVDTIAYTDAGKFTPTLNYSDRGVIKLTDVQGWGGGPGTVQAGYVKNPNVQDKLNAVRLSAKRELDMWGFSAVDFGVNFTKRTKTRSYVEALLSLQGQAAPYASAAVPGTAVAEAGDTGIMVPTFDPVAALGTIYQLNQKNHPDIYNKDWTVREKLSTAFGKLDIDTNWGGIPVRGNLGLQFVHTQQSSTAFSVDSVTAGHDDSNRPVAPVTLGASYNDVLPALNLVGDLGDGKTLRFALSKQMARPTMSDMRAANDVSLDTSTFKDAQGNIIPTLSGSGGNPLLKPFRARALDISFEKYYGSQAYWGIAGFYKKLDTYIIKAPTVGFDFRNITQSLPANATSPYGIFTQPVNGNGGNLSGVELTGSLPLNMVSKWMDGFGLFASYSNTHSSVILPISGLNTTNVDSPNVPLPGLSRKVASLALYYEKYGFSARIGQRYRSSFLGEVSDYTGDRQLTLVKSETVRDMQVGYEFGSGWLKGLSVLFQVNNMNNEPFIRYKAEPSSAPGNQVENTKYGKTYLFGINYKL